MILSSASRGGRVSASSSDQSGLVDQIEHEKGTDRDYYRIWNDCPGETRDYVPAIVALMRRNPAKYGF